MAYALSAQYDPDSPPFPFSPSLPPCLFVFLLPHSDSSTNFLPAGTRRLWLRGTRRETYLHLSLSAIEDLETCSARLPFESSVKQRRCFPASDCDFRSHVLKVQWHFSTLFHTWFNRLEAHLWDLLPDGLVFPLSGPPVMFAIPSLIQFARKRVPGNFQPV